MKRSLFLKCVLISALSLSFIGRVAAQDTRPFWNEIQDFVHKDSVSMPPPNGIVFLGSSSIRKWKDAETTFQDYQVINRGFGGSTLAQAADYLDYLVFPYHPREVVIYSGENDIAIDHTSAKETLDRLKTLVTKIRAGLPDVPIVFLSIKQSPSRAQYSNIVVEANRLIKSYFSGVSNTTYRDVNAKMLDARGKMRPELFQDDMLHLKPEGYDIWKKELRPHLIKK